MATDFTKKIQDVLGAVRNTINPEYAIPEDQKDNPIHVRILRLKATVVDIKSKMSEMSEDLDKIETNLNGLIEEILEQHPDVINADVLQSDASQSDASQSASQSDASQSGASQSASQSDVKGKAVVKKPKKK